MSVHTSLYNKLFNFSDNEPTVKKKPSADTDWTINDDNDYTALYGITLIVLLLVSAYTYIGYTILASNISSIHSYHISNQNVHLQYNVPQPTTWFYYVDMKHTNYNKQSTQLFRTMKKQRYEHTTDSILLQHYIHKYSDKYTAVLYFTINNIDSVYQHYAAVGASLHIQLLQYSKQNVIDTIHAWMTALAGTYLLVFDIQSNIVQERQLHDYLPKQLKNAHIIYLNNTLPIHHTVLCSQAVAHMSYHTIEQAGVLCDTLQHNLLLSSVGASVIKHENIRIYKYIENISVNNTVSYQHVVHTAFQRIKSIDTKSYYIATLMWSIAQQLQTHTIHLEVIHQYAIQCDPLLPTEYRITRQFDTNRAIRRMSVVQLLQYDSNTQQITFDQRILLLYNRFNLSTMHNCMLTATLSPLNRSTFAPADLLNSQHNTYTAAYSSQSSINLVQLPLQHLSTANDSIKTIGWTIDTVAETTAMFVWSKQHIETVLSHITNHKALAVEILKCLLSHAYHVQHDQKQSTALLQRLQPYIDTSEYDMYHMTMKFNKEPLNVAVKSKPSSNQLLNTHQRILTMPCESAEQMLDSVHQHYDNNTGTTSETATLIFDYTQLAQNCALNKQYTLARLIHVALYQLEKHLYTTTSVQIAARRLYIAAIDYAAQEYQKALHTIEECISTHSYVYGRNTIHSAYLNLLYGRIHGALNNPMAAIEKYQLAVDTIKNSAGTVHPMLLTVYEELVEISEQHQLYDTMFAAFNSAYELCRLNFGSQSEITQQWHRLGAAAARNMQLYQQQQAAQAKTEL